MILLEIFYNTSISAVCSALVVEYVDNLLKVAASKFCISLCRRNLYHGKDFVLRISIFLEFCWPESQQATRVDERVSNWPWERQE